MNATTRSSPGRARVVRAVAAAAIGLLGFTVAALVAPHAGADLLPPPPTVTLPVTLPTLPVTLPTVPGGSDTTGTTTTPTTTTPSSTSSTQSTPAGKVGPGQDAGRTEAGIAGAIRLANGAISIPVAGVSPPARLLVAAVRCAPRKVSRSGQPFAVAFRITDSRGYLVREALVDVRSVPAGYVKVGSVQRTALDGSGSLRFRTTERLPLRRGGKLILLVRVYHPVQHAWTAGTLVRVPIE